MSKSIMKNTRKIMLLPIVFALGYIPMIVHSYAYKTGLTVFDWFPESADMQIDFFLYYKMVAIIATSIVMIVLLIYNYLHSPKTFIIQNAWYCLAVYALFVFLSGLFSPNRSYAFKGGYEVFESVWVILGYVIICYYTCQIIQSEDDLKFVGKYAGIGVLIITLIGFFQFLGLDLFRTKIGKMLITSASIRDALGDLTFTFPLGTSYTTLYNTNYLAFYYGMIIPILIILILFSKKLLHKILYASMAGISFVTLIGSNSKSALLALGITIVLAMFVLRRYLKKYFWVPILVIILFLSIAGLYAHRVGGFLNLYNAIFVGVTSDTSGYAIKNIETLDDEIVFYLQDKELHVSYGGSEDSGISIYAEDAEGVALDYHTEGGLTMILDDLSYGNCTLTPVYVEEILSLKVSMDGYDWVFTNQTDGTYYYYNHAGKFTKIHEVKKAKLFPDSILSGRGYLWNHVVPKLKSSILLGTGANTFVMVYPQDNYIIKTYTGSSGLFDVKVHCMYLQQFLENGLLALLAFLAFYIWYFISSIKIYTKILNFTFSSILGLGILFGTFDYMIIAIANDSNVNTAPVFWVLLGAGIAINSMIKNNCITAKK